MKKNQSNRNARPNRWTRRAPAVLGLIIGALLVTTAFASVRARIENKPAAKSQVADHRLPSDWVWKKEAVTFDDMIRR